MFLCHSGKIKEFQSSSKNVVTYKYRYRISTADNLVLFQLERILYCMKIMPYFTDFIIKYFLSYIVKSKPTKLNKT